MSGSAPLSLTTVLCVCVMCRYQLKHARPSALTHIHTISLHTLHCTASALESRSFLSPVSPHRHTHALTHTSLNQRGYLFLFMVSWCPDSLPALLDFFSFPLFCVFLSLEYFPSQLNLGFLTASRALNSGKAEGNPFLYHL